MRHFDSKYKYFDVHPTKVQKFNVILHPILIQA